MKILNLVEVILGESFHSRVKSFDRFYHCQREHFGRVLSNLCINITLQIETEIRPSAFCWFIIIFVSSVHFYQLVLN